MNFGTIDFRSEVSPQKGNPQLLQAYAGQLIGEPVLFGAITYPHELIIHFGAQVEIKGPKGTVFEEGSYSLNAVGSAWFVKSASQGMQVFDHGRTMERWLPTGVPTLTEEQVERFLAGVGATTVLSLAIIPDVHGFGVRLIFSDGSMVGIVPTDEHYEHDSDTPDFDRVPDWEMFTPYKKCLRVGPGFQWSYSSSDKPQAAAK